MKVDKSKGGSAKVDKEFLNTNINHFSKVDKGGRYTAYPPKVDSLPFFFNPSLRLANIFRKCSPYTMFHVSHVAYHVAPVTCHLPHIDI